MLGFAGWFGFNDFWFPWQLFINGEFVPSVSGKTFAVVNPATGEEICRVAEAEKVW